MSGGWSLSYLFAHRDALGIAVEHPALLWLILLAPAFALLVRHATAARRSAAALRVAAYVCLVLALAGVALTLRLPSDQMSVVVAIDRSESIDPDGRAWEQRYVDQLVTRLAPDDDLGVVTFGQRPHLLRPPDTPSPVRLEDASIVQSATDVGAALDFSLALFPAGRERRLVLLSDGNQTRGDTLSKVPRARQAGVRVYTAAPPQSPQPEVSLDKLVAAPLVAEGSVFPIRATVRARGGPLTSALRLSIDGLLVGEEALTLQPGLTAIEMPYRLTGPGMHRLRAEVSAEGDRLVGNNVLETTVTVGGKFRVLVVKASPRSALARVLERKDVDVTLATPASLPARADELVGYHAVVLEDLSATALPRRSLDALERYVRDLGGALVVAAGETTFGDTGFKGSALARLLPVSLEPRRPPRAEREPMALFLLMDRSNSMAYHIRNRLERSDTESKLAYAKRAALAVVEQLKDTDLVGLIAFDSQPFELAKLRPLSENRARLEADIPRIEPGGGTDFFAALQSARDQLVASRINTAHVILLTDGDTNRGPVEHKPLIDSLARSPISVSTIRIGDDTVNLELLHQISERTGGTFYHVENAETLPQLLLQDTTQRVSEAPQQSATFAPRVGGDFQIVKGFKASDLPVLRGYAFSRPRPGADVVLHVANEQRKDPLLAAWQYGLGRVVCFTASPDDDAEAWVGWEGYGKFWSQVVHWAVRDQTASDYAFDVRRTDGEATVHIRTFTDTDGAVLVGRFFITPDQPVEVPLTPVGPREFSGRLPAVGAGRYPMSVMLRKNGNEYYRHTEVLQVPDTDDTPHEEFATARPNVALLRALAAGTGGEMDAPIPAIADRVTGTRRVDHPLDWLFVPAALLLFLADVAVRRLRV
jgi:Ca-activated chloride channel family protein